MKTVCAGCFLCLAAMWAAGLLDVGGGGVRDYRRDKQYEKWSR